LPPFFSPSRKQGDRIGQIFAHWVIVYFGQFFENYRSSPYICVAFFHGKVYAFILPKNGLGYILGGFFYKHIWSPCSEGRIAFKFVLFSTRAKLLKQQNVQNASKYFTLRRSISRFRDLNRAARFSLVQTNQNGKNIPDDHNLYQTTIIAVKYSKWS
jgi:hypothetical protein